MYRKIEMISKEKGPYGRLIIKSTSKGEISISTPDGPVKGSLPLGYWLYDTVQKFFEELVKEHAKEHDIDWSLFRRYDWFDRGE